MAEAPKASVIIPVYNAAAHLDECLDSVLSQTLSDIEVLCIDDGSTDASLQMLRKRAERDGRVVVESQENAGAGAARNHALDISQGEFVIFMDSDDYYPGDGTLERLYRGATDHGMPACGGSFSMVYKGEVFTDFKQDEQLYTFRREGVVNYRDYQYDYGYHRFLLSRAMLDAGPVRFPDFRRYQDPPFMVSALLAAGSFYAVPDVVYRYRTDDNAVTWDKAKVLALLDGIEFELEIAHSNDLAELYAIVLSRLFDDYLYAIMDIIRYDDLEVLERLVGLYSSVDDALLESASFHSSPFPLLQYFARRLDFEYNQTNEVIAGLRSDVDRLEKSEVHLKKDVAHLEEHAERLEEHAEKLEEHVEKLEGSRDMKVGRAILKLPRAIKRGL